MTLALEVGMELEDEGGTYTVVAWKHRGTLLKKQYLVERNDGKRMWIKD